MEVSRFKYQVHGFDTDAFRIVTAPRLLGFLLDSAGGSADGLGFGISELQRRGLTWVIGRIRIVVDSPLTAGDEVEVETWPSGIERSIALRDFRIWRGGELVGRATSHWFVLDMETRMPMRPQKILPEHLHPQTEHLVALPRVLSPLSGPIARQQCYEVRQSDIDLNQHVTAATYVSWALEAVPESLWRTHRLAAMDINFLEECHLGSRIRSESEQLAAAELRHRIVREGDERELARFATEWLPR